MVCSKSTVGCTVPPSGLTARHFPPLARRATTTETVLSQHVEDFEKEVGLADGYGQSREAGGWIRS